MKHAPIVVAFVIFFAASCDKQATPALDSRNAVEPPTATLSEQKMCAEQADKSFKDSSLSNDKSSLGNTYTNHYDAGAKVCYMETTSRHFVNNKFEYGHAIYDAFEGRVYGSFISMSDKPEDLMECYVIPRGQSKILCHSSDEFDSLALRYFGTTQD